MESKKKRGRKPNAEIGKPVKKTRSVRVSEEVEKKAKKKYGSLSTAIEQSVTAKPK